MRAMWIHSIEDKKVRGVVAFGLVLFFSLVGGGLGETVLPRASLREAKPGAARQAKAKGREKWEVRFEGEFVGECAPIRDPLVLWYRRPASRWVEALALGNGRLGAMVFGGVDQERLQLNEDTLWAGGPYDPNNPKALKYLPLARKLIFEGKYKEADRLIGQHMMAKPLRQMPYQPLGDLWIQFDAAWPMVKAYRRSLDLKQAVARTEFQTPAGVRQVREAFISAADQVIVWHAETDHPGQIHMRLTFRTPHSGTLTVEGKDTLVFTGHNPPARGIPGKLRFQCRIKVLSQGGTIRPENGWIAVRDADAVTVLIAAATNYKNYHDVSGDPEEATRQTIARACSYSYRQLKARYLATYTNLFNRVSLVLNGNPVPSVPTDERIRQFAKGQDPALAVLYFQFGRYLMISSSRPGTQPANLQGIWNDKTNPPWDSKYTININTEMNYWLPDPAGLPECVEPLVRMVEDLSHTGAKTARVMWGARGWVVHHNTDLWRATAPIDGPRWGFWPTGGAWLSLHLWDHFLYTGDTNYLRRIYPMLKGAAQFFLDTLVEDPKHGWLVTCPSLSPENAHHDGVSVCAGPTMDMQILRDLFSACIQASTILGVDVDLRSEWIRTRSQLAPNQIGRAGQLQEWLEDWDLQAPDRHHRHVSHLYGLFPSAQIHIRRTPKLAQAARKSLELRGDMATGWGLAWRLNLWARLHEGEHAYRLLQMLLSPSRTYPNMFDAHPPFQIDGNFGGARGILEMLVQSLPPDPKDPEHRFEIDLLPALPKAWTEGELRGVRTLGGCTLSMRWRNGLLEYVQIRSHTGWPLRIYYQNRVWEPDLKNGEAWTWKKQ